MDINEHNSVPISPQTQGDPPVNKFPQEEQTVRLWRNRIREAKRVHETAMKRIREDMEFAAGLQWDGQTSVDDPEQRYTANFITKFINDKVAALYAKNPKSEFKLRDRLNYQLWDGTVESEQQAAGAVQMSMMGGMPPPPEAVALLMDIQQGRQREAIMKKVGKVMQLLYEYQCDVQQPSFKFQMKQLVRRVITCGVGYVRLDYVNEFQNVISPTTSDDSFASRVKRVKSIMAGVQEDKIQSDDPRLEQLRELLGSLQSSVQEGDTTGVEEHLEFSFPDSTSIIVDPKCSSLKGFTGAKWIAQEHIMSLEDANSYFELTGFNRIQTGGDFVEYTTDGSERPHALTEQQPKDVQKSPLGCFWEVFDIQTKTKFWICDGWKWYVQDPAPVEPSINRFWPLFSLTFNDVVVETGQKVDIYPLSDVQLLKSIQRERNRSRDELKKHREVNRPFFGAMKGTIEDDDLDKLMNHETGELIQFSKVPQRANGGEDVENALFTWTGTPIDKNIYDSTPLEQDAALVTGSNQIQQGAGLRHVAATPAVIQEQARMSGNSSNVDDLDDLLSELACAGGEMELRAFKPETVVRVVGPGAQNAWPTETKEDFLNGVFLSIQAASSGRPNRAVDIQNAQQLIPLIAQAGGNPIALIEYLVKVLDANLNPADFFPVAPPGLGAPGSPSAQSGPKQQGSGSQQPQHPDKPMMHNQQPGRVGNQPGGQGLMPGVQQGGSH